jgi:hypothetical protein
MYNLQWLVGPTTPTRRQAIKLIIDEGVHMEDRTGVARLRSSRLRHRKTMETMQQILEKDTWIIGFQSICFFFPWDNWYLNNDEWEYYNLPRG